MIEIAEKYKNRYFINGQNLYDSYKVIIEKGGYEELTKESKRKNEYSYNWLDENGTQRYVSNKYESRTLSLDFIFVCENLAEYLSKKQELFDVLKGNYFLLGVTTLGKEWSLLYDSESNVEFLTDIYSGNEVIVKHTLSFFDDNVESGIFVPQAFLVDENGNFLTDEAGNFLTTYL